MGEAVQQAASTYPIRELTNDDELIGQLFGWSLDQRNVGTIKSWRGLGYLIEVDHIEYPVGQSSTSGLLHDELGFSMLKDRCVDFWQVRCSATADLGCYRALGCNWATMKAPKSSTVVGSHVELDDGAFGSG